MRNPAVSINVGDGNQRLQSIANDNFQLCDEVVMHRSKDARLLFLHGNLANGHSSSSEPFSSGKDS